MSERQRCFHDSSEAWQLHHALAICYCICGQCKQSQGPLRRSKARNPNPFVHVSLLYEPRLRRRSAATRFSLSGRTTAPTRCARSSSQAGLPRSVPEAVTGSIQCYEVRTPKRCRANDAWPWLATLEHSFSTAQELGGSFVAQCPHADQ
jgi:hypothetical protein